MLRTHVPVPRYRRGSLGGLGGSLAFVQRTGVLRALRMTIALPLAAAVRLGSEGLDALDVQRGQKRADLGRVDRVWREDVFEGSLEVLGLEVLGCLDQFAEDGLEGVG